MMSHSPPNAPGPPLTINASPPRSISTPTNARSTRTMARPALTPELRSAGPAAARRKQPQASFDRRRRDSHRRVRFDKDRGPIGDDLRHRVRDLRAVEAHGDHRVAADERRVADQPVAVSYTHLTLPTIYS